MKRITAKLILSGVAILGFLLPVYAADDTVTIKGSDTMIILVQRWAEEYMKSHPGLVIQATGGGSGTGIAALIDGATDICMASRPITPKEKQMVADKQNKKVVEIPVALDGIAIYVNLTNKVSELSFEQLDGIFEGKITNWKELKGPDLTIVAYGRENSSGTYAFFKEHVLKNKDFAPEVQSMPGTAAIVNAVSNDPKSIGYGGIGYAKGVKGVKVKKDAESKAYEPSMKNVLSKKYALSRNLFFYTAGKPSAKAKAFIDWALSSKGRELCKEVGYFPLAK